MHSATRGREPDRPDRSRPSPSLPKFPNRKIEGAQFSPFLPPVLQAPTTTGNCGIAWAGSLRIHDHKALTDSSCLAVCNPDHPDQSLSTKLAGAGLPNFAGHSLYGSCPSLAPRRLRGGGRLAKPLANVIDCTSGFRLWMTPTFHKSPMPFEGIDDFQNILGGYTPRPTAFKSVTGKARH